MAWTTAATKTSPATRTNHLFFIVMRSPFFGAHADTPKKLPQARNRQESKWQSSFVRPPRQRCILALTPNARRERESPWPRWAVVGRDACPEGFRGLSCRYPAVSLRRVVCRAAGYTRRTGHPALQCRAQVAALRCGPRRTKRTKIDRRFPHHYIIGMAVTDQQVIAKLRECYDPELPCNIVDLGLIYDVRLQPAEGTTDTRVDV